MEDLRGFAFASLDGNKKHEPTGMYACHRLMIRKVALRLSCSVPVAFSQSSHFLSLRQISYIQGGG